MRNISVLNVGNGACSVLRERCSADNNPGGRTAIIDCGSTSKGQARSAAQTLSENLEPADWRDLSELVVTHFDADHWEGLLCIVDNAPTASESVPPDLRIFFPNVPFGISRDLPVAIMTLITATSPTGVQVLDLRNAWDALTRPQLIPLVAGNSFSLAGRTHRVLWPPVSLDDRTTKRLNELVERIEREADHLAGCGYPQLQQSLCEAYANGPHSINPERSDRFTYPGYRRAEAKERPLKARPGNRLEPAIPTWWAHKPHFRKLKDAARAAQNTLSLIFHDPVHASLLVFGDAPSNIVQRVSADLLPAGYQVALAPHHGSQSLPPDAFHANICISQSGQRLHSCWLKYHKPNHLRDRCVNTHDGPSVIVRDLK